MGIVKSVGNELEARLPSANSYSFQSGFTLLELLVVMVVMGISLGIVIPMLMPDDGTRLREEGARLALLLENAGLEARSSGRAMAWSGEDSSYFFWRKNDYNEWARIVDDTEFRVRQLPEGIRIKEISVEDQVIKSGNPISLSSSAFIVPFRIRLCATASCLFVASKSTGEITISPDTQTGIPNNVRP